MSYISLLPFILLVVGAASTGILFQPGTWYAQLRKPFWTPPDWLFGPVWSVLYIMIAIAGWLVWETQGFGLLLAVWGCQLLFNTMWSWLFFGMRRMDLALVDAGLMWVSIAAFMVLAAPVVPVAALLFVPYLAWVTVATALNLTVMRMNPARA